MNEKFKKIAILTLCLLLYNLQYIKADGLDQAGDALINILAKGTIMLLFIIGSIIFIYKIRLNIIL